VVDLRGLDVSGVHATHTENTDDGGIGVGPGIGLGALIGGVVGAQRVVEGEPGQGGEFSVDAAEGASDLGIVE
jgi:hypothetical protein